MGLLKEELKRELGEERLAELGLNLDDEDFDEEYQEVAELSSESSSEDEDGKKKKKKKKKKDQIEKNVDFFQVMKEDASLTPQVHRPVDDYMAKRTSLVGKLHRASVIQQLRRGSALPLKRDSLFGDRDPFGDMSGKK